MRLRRTPAGPLALIACLALAACGADAGSTPAPPAAISPTAAQRPAAQRPPATPRPSATPRPAATASPTPPTQPAPAAAPPAQPAPAATPTLPAPAATPIPVDEPVVAEEGALHERLVGPPAAVPGVQQPFAALFPRGEVVLYGDGSSAKLGGAHEPGYVSWGACSNNQLRWSPDGHRLAMPGGVATLGAAGQAPAFAPVSGDDFSWSPDSSALAYLTGGGVDVSLLVLSVADGDQPRQQDGSYWLTTAPPVWSPAGDQLMAGADIVFEAGQRVSVKPPAAMGFNAVWSPDGRKIVWTAADGDDATLTIRLIEWDGAAERERAAVTLARDGSDRGNKIWWTDRNWAWPRLFWHPDGSLLLPVNGEGLADGGGTYRFAAEGSVSRISPHELCDLSPDGSLMLAQRLDGLWLAASLDGAILAELESALAARWRPALAGPPPPAPLAARSRTLAAGSGEAALVRELQTRLIELEYLAPPADGLFGPQTEAAVRGFQGKMGLEVDGIVGPRTWAELRDPNACRAQAYHLSCGGAY